MTNSAEHTTQDARRFLKERAAHHRSWRHHLHAHPEIAFQEHETATFLREHLAAMGLDLLEGIGGTGLVATLEGRRPGRCIGLRADMDALPITEADATLPHTSQRPGMMHACGHDGHMAMLLAAAEYLSGSRDFAGSIRFIFQPAEEAEGGGRRMVEEGLFRLAPVDAVFGLHNWPSLPLGQVAVQPGPMMASMDLFQISLHARGVHAALPHLGTDAIVAAGTLIASLQTIVSRTNNPHEPLVVSLTQIHGGNSLNALPDTVELHGTVRTFSEAARELVPRRMREITAGIAMSHDIAIDVAFTPGYPTTFNHTESAHFAAQIGDNLANAPALRAFAPSMASEDFAFMLRERPGAYAWIGNGQSTPLHSPYFDFNDELIPLGALYWIKLATAFLRRGLQEPSSSVT
ncbi:M20 aminoacylase family protein [Ancylobacter sp. SL191]|uniref:M20 aminoacylase family protein n=1 Tax=Ancylobacter sp. SL191 TaxID=2995166 RepID=UPI00226FC92E|nr:M20 aminoacylase family protein [Ancylobacter sp. SL191]WAC27532.1 M20 family metallopeptidase [Ancylobacter sp. SL191]